MAPSVRARHLKSLVAALDAFPAETAARIRAGISPALLRAIADAAGPEWLPLQANLELARAVHAAVGRAAFDAYFRNHQLASFRGPLLRAVVDGAVAIFGLDPGSYLRIVPSGWGLVLHDCGAWTPPRLVAPGHAEITLADLPAEAVADDVWPRSVAAALSAMVDLARTTGDLRVEAVDAPARAVGFALRWAPRGGGERR